MAQTPGSDPRVAPATGFMTQDERKKFESLHSDFNKYWVPCVWFTNLAAQARRDGRVRDDVALRLLLDVSRGPRGALDPHPQLQPLTSAACSRRLPGAEPVPGQVQPPLPLRLDQHPPGVHPGQAHPALIPGHGPRRPGSNAQPELPSAWLQHGHNPAPPELPSAPTQGG